MQGYGSKPATCARPLGARSRLRSGALYRRLRPFVVRAARCRRGVRLRRRCFARRQRRPSARSHGRISHRRGTGTHPAARAQPGSRRRTAHGDRGRARHLHLLRRFGRRAERRPCAGATVGGGASHRRRPDLRRLLRGVACGPPADSHALARPRPRAAQPAPTGLPHVQPPLGYPHPPCASHALRRVACRGAEFRRGLRPAVAARLSCGAHRGGRPPLLRLPHRQRRLLHEHAYAPFGRRLRRGQPRRDRFFPRAARFRELAPGTDARQAERRQVDSHARVFAVGLPYAAFHIGRRSDRPCAAALRCRWCVPSRRRSTPSENETGDLSQRSPVFHAISDRCQRHASRMRRAMAPSTLRASP